MRIIDSILFPALGALLRRAERRRTWASLMFGCCVLLLGGSVATGLEPQGGAFHVRPGQGIQEVLDAAAKHDSVKTVKVHEGVYRPDSKRQALLWLNHAHEGIHLEAVGRVTLTAENPDISNPAAASHPAVVNHVVYVGDGVSSNTVIRGFRITGARNFVTEKDTAVMEPRKDVPRNMFFFSDGGGIKVFGRSYPTLLDLEIEGNYTSPCGAGISIQHQGFNERWVHIENCVFRNNRTRVTGAAVDLLHGSAAKIINCLFVGNVSNTGSDIIAEQAGETPFTNSGVLTLFKDSRAWVEGCTFRDNRNGVDDMGGGSVYLRCLFATNVRGGGLVTNTVPYELDLQEGGQVSNCIINGRVIDPKKVIGLRPNVLNGPDPQFDARDVPRAPEYKDVGYRPKNPVR